MKNIIYAIHFGVGKCKVYSTRHGEWQARQMAKKRGGRCEVIKVLPLPDELGCERYRAIAHFKKQDFILGNSKADIRLAERLFLNGEVTKRKGNTKNLKPKEVVLNF